MAMITVHRNHSNDYCMQLSVMAVMLLFQQRLGQNLIMDIRSQGLIVLVTKLPCKVSAPQIVATAYISGEHHFCCAPTSYSTQFVIKVESPNIILYLFSR